MTDIAINAVRDALIDCGVKDVYIGEATKYDLDCCTIKPVDGFANTMFFGKTWLQEPLLEVIIRNKAYHEGQEQYNIAFDLLSAYINFDAGIRHCVIVGSPGYLGRSASGFGEWHFMVHLTLESVEEEEPSVPQPEEGMGGENQTVKE